MAADPAAPLDLVPVAQLASDIEDGTWGKSAATADLQMRKASVALRNLIEEVERLRAENIQLQANVALSADVTRSYLQQAADAKVLLLADGAPEGPK